MEMTTCSGCSLGAAMNMALRGSFLSPLEGIGENSWPPDQIPGPDQLFSGIIVQYIFHGSFECSGDLR